MLRIVPWTNRDEWLDTYHNLYNFDNCELQIKGIRRVEAWKSRSGSKLPLSVEATASLIAAGVEDVQSQASEYVIRQTMAMVIVRFVNSMVDMQQKGAYARSVQSIADQIGLPDWLVDLRHEATHANLPSLEVLRAGCKFALNWLRDCYWESQIAEFRERDENLAALIEEYARLCGDVWSHEKMVKNVKFKEIAKKIAKLVAKYNMWESLLVLSFGDEGSVVPPSEILHEVFSETTEGIKTTDISLKLPKDLQKSLLPLLKAMHKINANLLSNFVLFLGNKVYELELNSKNVLLVHFYSCVIYFILFNCSKNNNEKKQWKIIAELDYVALLETFLKRSCTYSQEFVPIIIENLAVTSESLKVKLRKFSTIKVAFSKEENLNKPAQDEKTIFEKLKQQFPVVAEQLEAKVNSLQDEPSSVWQECPHSFANDFKFGSFLGEKPIQIDDTVQTNAEVFQDEATLEDNDTRGEDTQEMIDIEFEDSDASITSLENETNEDELSSSSEASDALVPKNLTDEMIKEISEKIWIF